MRCSDCKSFKTEDCKVNPNGDDCCSAEIFSCFKPSAIDTEYDAGYRNGDKSGVNTVRISAVSLGFGISGILIVIAFILIIFTSIGSRLSGSGGAAFLVLLAICDIISISCGMTAIVINRKTHKRGLWMAISGITLSVLNIIGLGVLFLMIFLAFMSM